MPMGVTYCATFLTEPGCGLGNRCPLRHDIRRCSCDLVVCLNNFDAHVKGKRHKQELAEFRKLQRTGTSATPLRTRSDQHEEEFKRCEFCKKDTPSARFTSHIEEHQRRQRRADVQAAFADAALDKNGVAVSGEEGIDFGVIDSEAAIESSSLVVTISRIDPEARVRMSNFYLSSSVRKDGHGVKFSVILLQSRWINARPRSLQILFHPSYAGRYEDRLELVFFDTRRKQTFVITRRILAIVGSKDDHEQLKPKSPYVSRKAVLRQPEARIIPSLRPPTWTRTKWAMYLPDFKPPDALIQAAYPPHGRPSTQAIRKFRPSAFNKDTYGKWFQVMLHIEEEKMQRDLDSYSLEGVELKPKYPRYELEVKGLEEGRPSVIVGDSVLVKHKGATNDTWYEGCVYKVYHNHISLRFGGDFSTFRGTKFDVRFKLNRLPHRRMHQALTNSINPPRLLFPARGHLKSLSPVSNSLLAGISPVNRDIGEDREQLETVGAILHLARGSPPFVVFGPPGTGKTVTIVEAIRQLLLHDPEVRILACAPSNSAADLIATKLTVLGRTQVFRLNSLSRKFTDLPKTLQPFSLINDNRVFAIPPAEDLRNFRVVVSTCISGGVPSGLGIKRGHFSHVFVDEAGQCTEPEVMIPIKTMADESTNVILAGDNKQLGPIVHSSLPVISPLKQSYLARIMELDTYDLKTYNGITIVKLVKNFRSHPAILQFSNRHFYNGELIPCGNPAITHSLEQSDELVTKKFPLVFHGVIGRDEREESDPSFFNIDEATIVKNYCQSLISNRKNKIRAEHIGVITPYHAQRCKILNLLSRDHKHKEIKVGSVEEFQGQERRIIIISTVRSTMDFVDLDLKRHLGFVADPRRFNVALTRAQAFVIVVGNPIILSLDPLWRQFLNYVHEGGGWRGVEINWNPEDLVNPSPDGYTEEMRRRAEVEVDEDIERLRAMIQLRNDDSNVDIYFSDDDSGSEGQADGPAFWREGE